MGIEIWLFVEVDTGGEKPFTVSLYDCNQTHNLGPMWVKAECYNALYESAGKTAGEILPILEKALVVMENDRTGFEELNPENGWGSYKTAIGFLKNLTQACREHPKATIGVSR